jgi:hypothetical protein
MIRHRFGGFLRAACDRTLRRPPHRTANEIASPSSLRPEATDATAHPSEGDGVVPASGRRAVVRRLRPV